MNPILNFFVVNSLLAGLAAVMLLMILWRVQRPMLAHFGWLFVLAKLVTPPLIAIPIFEGLWPVTEVEVANPPEPAPLVTTPLMETSSLTAPIVDSIAEPTVAAVAVAESPFDWELTLVVFWLVGAISWWSLVLWRVHQFRHVLRACRPVHESVRRRSAGVANRLGLKRIPAIYFVDYRVSPLVWAMNFRPIIILPKTLWNSLNREQQETILAHELAHVARGDHWVRRLEVVVLGLYWWLPLAWLARHYLHQAEEACCDSRVLAALPDRSTEYAEALLETVSFISRPRWQPLASGGAVQARYLERRLTMIMTNSPARLPSRKWGMLALAAGLLALPLNPGLADEKKVKIIQIQISEDGKTEIKTIEPATVDPTKAPEAPAPKNKLTEVKQQFKLILQKDGEKPQIIELQGLPTADVLMPKLAPLLGGGQPAKSATGFLFDATPAVPQPPQPQPTFARISTAGNPFAGKNISELQDEIELLEAQATTKKAMIEASAIGVESGAKQAKLIEEAVARGAAPVSEKLTIESNLARARAEIGVRKAELNEVEVRIKQAKRKLEEAKKGPSYGFSGTTNSGQGFGGFGGGLSGTIRMNVTPPAAVVPAAPALPVKPATPAEPKPVEIKKSSAAPAAPATEKPLDEAKATIEKRIQFVTDVDRSELKKHQAELQKAKAELDQRAAELDRMKSSLTAKQKELEAQAAQQGLRYLKDAAVAEAQAKKKAEEIKKQIQSEVEEIKKRNPKQPIEIEINANTKDKLKDLKGQKIEIELKSGSEPKK
jgi:beta-lactamase regulating signal transducer with metallopeptidase domain